MKKSIVFVYNSFSDPLFQGNLFQHLLAESKEKRLIFLLITFEQLEFRLTSDEIKKIRQELLTLNIKWYPLRWHSGRLLLIKKLYDMLHSFFLVLKLKLVENPTSIVSLGTISGSFSFILKKVFGLFHYAYQYEPHSLFMKDFGIWNEKGLKFRLLNYFETQTAKNADIISTGTSHMSLRLREMGISAEVYKLPSCINEDYFNIEREQGLKIRNELGISIEANVVIYVGKFGGIYFDDEIIDLFSALNKKIDNLFALILTPDNQKQIEDRLISSGVSKYWVRRVPYREVYKYINASNIGISGVPGLPSQKYRSPIKVGEYMLCGVPYITCKGVSEDDEIAEKLNVGVVLQDFSDASIEQSIVDIVEKMGKRDSYLIRNVGLNYRGLSNHMPTIKRIFAKLSDC